MNLEINIKFNSIEEFEQWKKDITAKAVIEEHKKKIEIIEEIIKFGMDNPEQIYILQDYSQVGGDTLEEYFKNLQ